MRKIAILLIIFSILLVSCKKEEPAPVTVKREPKVEEAKPEEEEALEEEIVSNEGFKGFTDILRVGDIRVSVDFIPPQSVRPDIPIVEKAVQENVDNLDILYVYFYSARMDTVIDEIAVTPDVDWIDWTQVNVNVEGVTCLLQTTPELLPEDMNPERNACISYIYWPEDTPSDPRIFIRYAGEVPSAAQIEPDEPEGPQAAYTKDVLPWIAKSFTESFGADPISFNPATPQPSTCILVRADDSPVAVDNAQLKTAEEATERVKAEARTIVHTIEGIGKGAEAPDPPGITFTGDPNLASLLLVYSLQYPYSYDYSGGIAGYSCILTIHAYNLRTHEYLGSYEDKTHAPNMIQTFSGQKEYYADIPLLEEWKDEFKALLDKMRAVQ